MRKVLVVLAIAFMFMMALASCSEHVCPAYSHNTSIESSDLSE